MQSHSTCWPVQLQFHARGPSGRAVVNADMYQEGREWIYNFLYLDIEAPVPQQVRDPGRGLGLMPDSEVP